MAKTIINALIGLNFDDSPSNLAAATLFYLLTGDVSHSKFARDRVNSLQLPPTCIDGIELSSKQLLLVI